MPYLSIRQRAVIAFGGLILLTGFTMLSLALLGALNLVEIETIIKYSYLKEILVIIGVLDIIAGIILSFVKK